MVSYLEDISSFDEKYVIIKLFHDIIAAVIFRSFA